jgi:hypothetical protein
VPKVTLVVEAKLTRIDTISEETLKEFDAIPEEEKIKGVKELLESDHEVSAEITSFAYSVEVLGDA